MGFDLLVLAVARARGLEVRPRVENREANLREQINRAITAPLENLGFYAPKMILFKGKRVFVKFTLTDKQPKVKRNKLSDCFKCLPPTIIRAVCDFFLPSYRLVELDFNTLITLRIPHFKKTDSFHTALKDGKIENSPSQLAVWLRLPNFYLHDQSKANWRKEMDPLPGFDPYEVVKLVLVCKRWNEAFRLVADTKKITRLNISDTIQSLRWQVFFSCFMKSSGRDLYRLKQIFYELFKSGRNELLCQFLHHLQNFTTPIRFAYLFETSGKYPSAFSHLLEYNVRKIIGNSYQTKANIRSLFAFIINNKLYSMPDVFDPLIFYQIYGKDSIRKNLKPFLIAIHIEKDKEAKRFFVNLLELHDTKLHNVVYHTVLHHDYEYLTLLCELFPNSVKVLGHHKDVRSILKLDQTKAYYVEMDKCYTLLYKFNALLTNHHPTFQFLLDHNFLPILKNMMKNSMAPVEQPKKTDKDSRLIEVSDDSDVEIIAHRRSTKKSYLRTKETTNALALSASSNRRMDSNVENVVIKETTAAAASAVPQPAPSPAVPPTTIQEVVSKTPPTKNFPASTIIDNMHLDPSPEQIDLGIEPLPFRPYSSFSNPTS